jgi:hypothetical protein
MKNGSMLALFLMLGLLAAAQAQTLVVMTMPPDSDSHMAWEGLRKFETAFAETPECHGLKVMRLADVCNHQDCAMPGPEYWTGTFTAWAENVFGWAVEHHKGEKVTRDVRKYEPHIVATFQGDDHSPEAEARHVCAIIMGKRAPVQAGQ